MSVKGGSTVYKMEIIVYDETISVALQLAQVNATQSYMCDLVSSWKPLSYTGVCKLRLYVSHSYDINGSKMNNKLIVFLVNHLKNHFMKLTTTLGYIHVP